MGQIIGYTQHTVTKQVVCTQQTLVVFVFWSGESHSGSDLAQLMSVANCAENLQTFFRPNCPVSQYM